MAMPKIARLFQCCDTKASQQSSSSSITGGGEVGARMSRTMGSGRWCCTHFHLPAAPISGHKAQRILATMRPGDVLLAKHVIKLSLTTNSTPRQDSIITSQGRRKRIKCQTIGRNKRTGESEEEEQGKSATERERANGSKPIRS